MAGRSLDDLGTEFSWLDFAAFVKFAPLDSRLSVAVLEHPVWSRTDMLLASAIDALRAGNWQRGGGKGTRPQPIKVPGFGQTDKKFGKATDMESVRSYLESRNGRAPEVR